MPEQLTKTPKTTTSTNGKASSALPVRPKPNPEQLEEALKSVEWIMDCAQSEFFLMDELSRFVWDHEPDVWLNSGTVDTISVGVKRNWVTGYTSSTVKSMAQEFGFGSMPNEWQWEYDGVPVRVTIIERNYKYLENLDQKPHLSSFFKVPNPFEKYWASRFLVK